MKGRDRFLTRVQPALDAVLEPGEPVRASGFAMVMASRGMHVLVGAAATLMSKYYWIAVTDRRLIVLKFQALGTKPVLERAVPLSSAKILKRKPGLFGTRLELDVDGSRYALRFPVQFKADAEAIAVHLSRQNASPFGRP